MRRLLISISANDSIPSSTIQLNLFYSKSIDLTLGTQTRSQMRLSASSGLTVRLCFVVGISLACAFSSRAGFTAIIMRKANEMEIIFNSFASTFILRTDKQFQMIKFCK